MKILWKIIKIIIEIYLKLTVLWWVIIGLSEIVNIQRKNPSDSIEEMADKIIIKTIKRYGKWWRWLNE